MIRLHVFMGVLLLLMMIQPTLAIRFADVDLGTISDPNGFKALGVAQGNQAGFSVSKAGDINGDGISDVIIGAPFADPVISATTRTDAGVSYILFGRNGASHAFSNVPLSIQTSNPSLGFRIFGEAASDQSGTCVGEAGDVNGDGVDDFLIGAIGADPLARSNAGAAYVVFGRNSKKGSVFSDIDLTTFRNATTAGFRILGAAAGDAMGKNVNTAGDVNGDGLADIVVGSNLISPVVNTVTRINAGTSYVIFGRNVSAGSSLFVDIDLNVFTASATAGFRIIGGGNYHSSGITGGAAGDVNGDGVGDIVTSSYYQTAPNINSGTMTRNYAGAVYVIFGRNVQQSGSVFADIDLNALSALVGVRIWGAAGSDSLGYSVSRAGDVNGDGVDDMVLGAYGGDPVNIDTTTRSNAGITYVLYGRRGVWKNMDFNNFVFNASSGFRILGAMTSDVSGRSVSNAGDVNQDGLADVIVGAHMASPVVRGATRSYAGSTYIVLGRNASVSGDVDLATFATGSTAGYRLMGASSIEYSGCSVSDAGDFNGDGRADIITGGNGASSSTGVVYMVFEIPGGRTSAPTSQPSRQPSSQPSRQPIGQPSAQPSSQPTCRPTSPTSRPSAQPSRQPSSRPSNQPSRQPTAQPSGQPTRQPTLAPSAQPSGQPSSQPSGRPTSQPTGQPSLQSTAQPSGHPSAQPINQPSGQPSAQPSMQPSSQPTARPSSQPSSQPTGQPSTQPSAHPSTQPTSQPTRQPTGQPSRQPSSQPSSQPTRVPTGRPSRQPTAQPSAQPLRQPSYRPSGQPTSQPSGQPSVQPTSHPTSQPLGQPSTQPSAQPSCQPSCLPSAQPSTLPTTHPSSQPSNQPSAQPSGSPTHEPSSLPTSVSVNSHVAPRTGEWATWLPGSTRLATVSNVQNLVWVCGSNSRPGEAVCVVVNVTAKAVRTQYGFALNTVTKVFTTSTSGSVHVLGQINSPSASNVVACTLQHSQQYSSQLLCAVTSLLGATFVAVSYVPYPQKIVYVGWYNVYTCVSIVDARTSSVLSNLYTAYNMHSLALSQVQSPPNFVGSFVAGSCVRASGMSAHFIVASMVRTADGTMTGMYMYPVMSNIVSAVDLVTSMALESTGPDSFIAGGLQLSDGMGMHAYLLRANSLYSTIQYGARYRCMASDCAQSQSVVRAMALLDSIVYLVVNHLCNKGDASANANASSVVLLKISASSGAILKQVRLGSTVIGSGLECTDITTSGLFLVIVCNSQPLFGPVVSFLLAVDGELTLQKLPEGIVRNDTNLLHFENVPFDRKALQIIKTSTAVLFTSGDFISSNQDPSPRPSAAPTVIPSSQPSSAPSAQPSSSPTAAPSVSARPTSQPSTSGPTNTNKPSIMPSPKPTSPPTPIKTTRPSFRATVSPSAPPTLAPTTRPSRRPTTAPSCSPTRPPSARPTHSPTSATPSRVPTASPTTPDLLIPDASKRSQDVSADIVGGAVGAGLFVLLIGYGLYMFAEKRRKTLDREKRFKEYLEKETRRCEAEDRAREAATLRAAERVAVAAAERAASKQRKTDKERRGRGAHAITPGLLYAGLLYAASDKEMHTVSDPPSSAPSSQGSSSYNISSMGSSDIDMAEYMRAEYPSHTRNNRNNNTLEVEKEQQAMRIHESFTAHVRAESDSSESSESSESSVESSVSGSSGESSGDSSGDTES